MNPPPTPPQPSPTSPRESAGPLAQEPASLTSVVQQALTLTPAGAAELLWLDQRARWERGEMLQVEAYLAAAEGQLPESVTLDLIYGERRLREQSGQGKGEGAWEAFHTRFPHLASGLRRQEEFESVVEELFDEPSATRTLDAISWPLGSGPAKPAGSPPEKIGKYVVIGQIDAGAQAEVFRVAHPGLQRELVIKLARRTCPLDDPWRERLPAEGRVLAEFEHPGLARIYDLDFHEDRPYLVMEYVRGQNLDQYVRRRMPSPREAAALVQDVAVTLAAAHERGILHLDIKPHNILVDEQGRPRLIDFGLARVSHAWAREEAQSEGLSGTIPYMSPEQATGDDSRLTARSDIYSLGGVLYFLLTGHAPLEDSSLAELLDRAGRGDWDREKLASTTIPVALRRICERALAREEASRYGSMAELASDLQRFTRPSWTERLSARSRLLVAAVVAATVVGGGVWLSTRPPFGSEGDKTNTRAGDETGQTGTGSSLASPDATARSSGSSLTAVAATRIEVRVWRAGGEPRDLAECLPLHSGDEIAVHAEIPAGQSALLVGYNSTDGLRVLGQREAAATDRMLRFPANSAEKVPLVGPAVTEWLALCVQAGDVPTLAALEKRWEQDATWPAWSGDHVLRVDPQTLRLLQASRSFGSPRKRTDPEQLTLDRLVGQAEKLAGAYPWFEIMAIPCQ
ncbi:MAG: serine/threonine-protein kinase [Pirellulales bacterium]